jgi:hypothetical protein
MIYLFDDLKAYSCEQEGLRLNDSAGADETE